MNARTVQTRTYFDRCLAIVRPVLVRVVISAMSVITVLAVDLKYTIEGSSWMYSVINAAMIATGIGLAILSTAMIRSNERRK
jgi:di/tricarboxylate transporter